jgi:uncharacterized protein
MSRQTCQTDGGQGWRAGRALRLFEVGDDDRSFRPDQQQGNRSRKLRSLEKRRWQSIRIAGPEAEWTIVGSSPLSKTYRSRKEFLDEVGVPFDARMAKPPVRTLRGIYADGNMVIILFDIEATARDGLPYNKVYTWYFQMKDAKVVKAIGFFDTRIFDEFWTRVSPKP